MNGFLLRTGFRGNAWPGLSVPHKKEEPLAYEYPDRPTNRPDPIMKDGHKAPDARKTDRTWIPIMMAVIVLVIATGVTLVVMYGH